MDAIFQSKVSQKIKKQATVLNVLDRSSKIKTENTGLAMSLMEVIVGLNKFFFSSSRLKSKIVILINRPTKPNVLPMDQTIKTCKSLALLSKKKKE